MSIPSARKMRRSFCCCPAPAAIGKAISDTSCRCFRIPSACSAYLENSRVAGDWTRDQFCALTAEARRSMGLRAVQLRADIPLCTPRARGAPILALEGVSLFHRKRTVLQNLSLQAARGDVIAVIGRSGAGKTTFARALCGLHHLVNPLRGVPEPRLRARCAGCIGKRRANTDGWAIRKSPRSG